MSPVIVIPFLVLLLSAGRAEAAVEDQWNDALATINSNPWPWVAAAACLGMVILFCYCCRCNGGTTSLLYLNDEAYPAVIRCTQEVRNCHFTAVSHLSGSGAKEAAVTKTGRTEGFLVKDFFLWILDEVESTFLWILDEVKSIWQTIVDFIGSWFRSGKSNSAAHSELIGKKRISEPLDVKFTSEPHPWAGKKQPDHLSGLHDDRNVHKDVIENVQLPSAKEKSQAPIGEPIIQAREETKPVSIVSQTENLVHGPSRYSRDLDGRSTFDLPKERYQFLSRTHVVTPTQAKTYLGDHRFGEDKGHAKEAVTHHRTHYHRQMPSQPAGTCIKEIVITAIISIFATSALFFGVYALYQHFST